MFQGANWDKSNNQLSVAGLSAKQIAAKTKSLSSKYSRISTADGAVVLHNVNSQNDANKLVEAISGMKL